MFNLYSVKYKMLPQCVNNMHKLQLLGFTGCNVNSVCICIWIFCAPTWIFFIEHRLNILLHSTFTVIYK